MEVVVQSFLETIERWGMITSTDKVLVAVSGGPDSMALLHLMVNNFPHLEIGVFHLDHQFRPESGDEAKFVDNMAREWGVSSHIISYNVTKYLERTGDSKQQGARRVRYRFVEEIVKKHGYTKVALGHHADDQAETVLMRLLRGSGPSGLTGIAYVRGPYIRPLLRVFKSELVEYCQQQEIPYVLDSSNLESNYFRNKIRNQLIPRLEKEYNPNFRTTLIRLADILTGDELVLADYTSELLEKLIRRERNSLLLDRKAFQQLLTGMQRRVLRQAIAEYLGQLRRIEFEHIERVRQAILLPGTFKVEIPQVMVNITANSIVLGPSCHVSLEPTVLSVPGDITLGRYRIFCEILGKDEDEHRERAKSDVSEDFDLSQLKLPLVVRQRKLGDKMVLFGQNSPKKVKDILINAKIPDYEKDEIPLVCDQDDILWVVGVRRSEKGRIVRNTQQILRISFRKA